MKSIYLILLSSSLLLVGCGSDSSSSKKDSTGTNGSNDAGIFSNIFNPPTNGVGSIKPPAQPPVQYNALTSASQLERHDESRDPENEPTLKDDISLLFGNPHDQPIDIDTGESLQSVISRLN